MTAPATFDPGAAVVHSRRGLGIVAGDHPAHPSIVMVAFPDRESPIACYRKDLAPTHPKE